MTIQLVVGLQNPGTSYKATRHNAGGWFVDALVNQAHAILKTEKSLQAEIAVVSSEHLSYKVALPLTFMNHSGRAVRSVSNFYRILPENILIVHDDLDLPVGRVKLKTGGGHGGHNGIRDIIQQLGTADFHRLRVGIGHPGHKDGVFDYVLGKPSVDDRNKINHAIEQALTVMPLIISDQWPLAMNILGAKT